MVRNTRHPVLSTLQVLPSHPLDFYYRDFILDAEAANRTPGTVAYYREKLTVFLDFLKRQGIEEPQEIKPSHLRAYLAELSKTHNSGGVMTFFRTMRTFLRFLVNQEVLETNPIEKVRAPKVDLEPLEPVNLEHLQAMLETCDKSEISLRDKAILLTLLDSGCRAREFVALNVADFDLATGAITIRKSKSRKPRTTFAGRQARRAIAAYLRLRGDVKPDDPLWLAYHMVDGDGETSRLTYPGLRQLVRRRAQKAGVPMPSLHAFRRGFAIFSLRSGADPVSISRMLGHGSLGVTMRYLRQQVDDLAAVHQEHSPVDRLKL
ncbi:MAG: tyrosine-type recombinase/integrase [Chloroflexi bacterium]|nr:tyrosine-type recombinase/integrase [Chloroflexota bacterium]